MEYAVFDVDGTLINKDSLLISAWFSNNKIQLLIRSFLFSPIFILSKIGLVSEKSLKEKFLKFFNICDLFNNPQKNKKKEEFKKILIKSIKPEAIKRINYHKSLGHKVLLCSASPRMIITFLSELLEIDLICTELYMDKKKWLPRLKGNNCKGIEKVMKIEKLIGELKTKNLHAYGDSIGDKELLNESKWPHWRSFSDEIKEYPRFSLYKLIPFIIFVLLIYIFYIFRNYGLGILPILNNLKFEISLGLLLVLLGYLIRFFRWRIFMKVLNLYIPFKEDLILWIGSYAFTATPGKTGEGLRSVLLKEKFKLPIEKTLAAVLMERLSDALSVSLILIFNFYLSKDLHSYFLNPFTFLILIIIIIFFIKRINISEKFLNKFEILARFNLFNSIVNSFKFLKKLLNLNLILMTTILGIFSWSCEGISFFILLRGLDFSNISYSDAAIAHLGAGLIGSISFLPGGLGATEVSTSGILLLKNIPLKEAITSTIIIRLMTLWFATFLGFICLIIIPFKKLNFKY